MSNEYIVALLLALGITTMQQQDKSAEYIVAAMREVVTMHNISHIMDGHGVKDCEAALRLIAPLGVKDVTIAPIGDGSCVVTIENSTATFDLRRLRVS
jgi:hypothetical protein